MKPLYDRYRLVKQILCRASTIPVIVSITSLSSFPLLFFFLSCPVAPLLPDKQANLKHPHIVKMSADT